MASDDYVFAVFKNRDATHVTTDKGLVSTLGLGLALLSDASLRISFGIPFGQPTFAMGDGAAQVNTLVRSAADEWTFNATVLSQLGLGVRLVGDAANRLTLGTISGLPTIGFGDGTGAATATLALTSAAAGILTLTGALLASVLRTSPAAKTASWTFAAGDDQKVILFNHATVAANATIPPNSSVAYPVGTELRMMQQGAAGITVIAGAGVTLEAAPTGWLNGTLAVGACLTYRQRAADVWTLVQSTDVTGLALSFQPISSLLTSYAANPAIQRTTTIASNATWAPNADTTDIFTVTAQAVAATTISNPSGTPVNGQRLTMRIKDDGTARALTWSGTTWRAGNQLGLPATTIAGQTLVLRFLYNSTDTKWDLQDAPLAPDVQEFTGAGSYTWTAPTNAKMVLVEAIAPGGGGGGGRRGAAATLRKGGGGGAGGATVRHWLTAADAGATIAVTIGAAGTGGAGATVDSTAGADGVAGADVTIGALLTVKGGNPGLAAGLVPGWGGVPPATELSAGYGGTSAGALAVGTTATSSGGHGMTGGGGCGGDITAANALAAGATGGNGLAGAGGTGASGANGNAGTAGTKMKAGGGGAGGASRDATGAAYNGGAGGAGGGGGGGGGASLNGQNGGAGGAGGAGYVRITTYR